MDTRQLEIACPCCKSRLLIDVRTQTVLRTQKPGETDAEGKPKVGEKDWGAALTKVQDREAGGTSKMDALLEGERDKQQRLEDRFKAAQEKLRDKPESD